MFENRVTSDEEFLDKANKWREYFPFFKENKTLFLDSAGTTLKLESVIKSINDYYTNYSLNLHSASENNLFQKINRVIIEARKLVISEIGGESPEEVVFTPSATYSFNFLALACKLWLKKGDEIGLTYLEHSSNYYPWELLTREIGVKLVFFPLVSNGQIDLEKLGDYVSFKMKIVSFSQVSNALGTVNPVVKISQIVKEKNPTCLIIVDACQSLSNGQRILARKWKIDVVVFSAHKVYGPTGLGVMWVSSLSQNKFVSVLWGGGRLQSPIAELQKKSSNLVYFKSWEVGTLPLAQIFGLRASLKWLKEQKRSDIVGYVTALVKYTMQKLIMIPTVVIYNRYLEKGVGIITFNLLNCHSQDVVDYLGRNNLVVRGGDFCCPYIQKIIKTNSAIRISLSLYNTIWEVDRLISLLTKIKNYSSLI